MKEVKKIFIAATGQNVGKTTTSIGLFDKLLQKGIKAGFIKPVGQRYIEVNDFKVDEDSYLVKKIYNPDTKLKDMNPISVPKGFTEKYIDDGNVADIKNKILKSYRNIEKLSDFVVIEGTGHAGVGSVFDASNADVASWLKTKVIIVTNAGIGRSIDELTLNKNLFEQHGVEVLGVIINRVLENKYDKIKKYVEKGLAKKNIKLLGAVPYLQNLEDPYMEQIKNKVKGKFINGESRKYSRVNKIIVGAMSVRHLVDLITENTLLITPGDREDVLLTAVSLVNTRYTKNKSVSGIIITGKTDPNPSVLEILKASDVCVVRCEFDTFTAASYVHNLKIKIQVNDQAKIKLTQEIFDKYIDID